MKVAKMSKLPKTARVLIVVALILIGVYCLLKACIIGCMLIVLYGSLVNAVFENVDAMIVAYVLYVVSALANASLGFILINLACLLSKKHAVKRCWLIWATVCVITIIACECVLAYAILP